ncbi:sulfurtransferase complex subunit TusC [Marinobacter hydrocarbonoclasticus]|nr:sulfurtransferase complex subunit TusC [Marinobacter nauticus]
METNQHDLAVVFRHAPHGTATGREGLDLLLLAASYDQLCAALFVGDGVYQLVRDQAPSEIEAKDYIATFKALPIYDVETVVVCQASLDARGLSESDLILPATLARPDDIAELLGHSQQVLTF